MNLEQDYMELLELQQIIQEGIEDALPGIVRVRAEVASVQQRSNNHCYLELCQSGPLGVVAKVRAIIWKSRAGAVLGKFSKANGSALQAGMALVFEGRVNYSELYGVSLIIEDIDVEHTLGEAELRRRRTLERLEKEGLLDMQKELALPDVPYSLAVISAHDAAGYGDFCRHLLENEYGFAFEVTLFEATMQGDGAPASIIAALDRIKNEGVDYDSILILRGGGSVLDLACFDDYELCEAIARFPLPVLTAIGHDRDEHAADRVANISVKTPTALADIFIDALAAEDERITAFQNRLRLAFAGKLASLEEGVTRAEARLRLSFAGKLGVLEECLGRNKSRLQLALVSKLSAAQGAADKLQARIRFALNATLTGADAALSKLETRITAANPRLLLERGYTLVAGGRGALIKRASEAKEGDHISVIFPDGSLHCLVEGITHETHKNGKI
ncbi:MAG: exodeoxyribonuclease VII large subunit [Bacteroidales bacterium]|nr:exodeoxyribonuclease VII large subunit [Bacteroidales bacterium]MBR0290758.1 exodeoxyribonuclease VII large subunit [Bacteroidales bacterium]